MFNLLKKIKKSLTITLFISLGAWLFGLYSGYQVELREDRKAQKLNDQTIVQQYFDSVKEIRLSNDYELPNGNKDDDQAEKSEETFIHNLTLVALRGISPGSERKAAIVLLLNKLQIPEKFISNTPNNYFYKGADLKFTDFSGYDFKGANLSKADLRGAIFHEAELQKSQLIWAKLTCGSMPDEGDWGWVPIVGKREGEKPQCVDLTEAKLSHANLWGANLTGANLSGANLGVGITGTKFLGNNLFDVVLPGANLTHANLTNADLTGANLSVNLPEEERKIARLTKKGYDRIDKYVDLFNANLSNANLTNADLSDADLSNANLSDAILVGTKLNGTKFNGTRVKNLKG